MRLCSHAPDFLSVNADLKNEKIELFDISAIAESAKILPPFQGIRTHPRAAPVASFHNFDFRHDRHTKGSGARSHLVDDQSRVNWAKWHQWKVKSADCCLAAQSYLWLGSAFDLFSFRATVVFCDLTPNGFFACINKYDPHMLVGVPTVYAAMLNIKDGLMNLHSAHIMLSGGAPLPVSLAEDFLKKYGKKLNNGYGSTESKIIALNLIDRMIPLVSRFRQSKLKLLAKTIRSWVKARPEKLSCFRI